jgi:GNAT superfamily N-acetyltransferase
MIRSVQSIDRAWLHAMGHTDGDIARMLDPGDKPLLTKVWQDADGRVVGSASAGPLETASGAWLSGLVRVAPYVQGRGIGTAVVQAALEAARAEGASHVQCYIEPHNISSIRAHERAGYVRVGAVRSFLVRASTLVASAPEDLPPEIEEVDAGALSAVTGAAGYTALIRYFPRLSAACRPPTKRNLGRVARHVLDRLRNLPTERRLVLRSGDRALLGIILMGQGEPRLMTARARVPELTVLRLAAMEKVVSAPYWPRDQTKGFLLLHDDQAPPNPELVLKTQQIYVA